MKKPFAATLSPSLDPGRIFFPACLAFYQLAPLLVDKLGVRLAAVRAQHIHLKVKVDLPGYLLLGEHALQGGALACQLALGGKLLGAGGGGYLLLLCKFDKWHIVAEKLEMAGGKIVDFAFDFRGLQSWEFNNR